MVMGNNLGKLIIFPYPDNSDYNMGKENTKKKNNTFQTLHFLFLLFIKVAFPITSISLFCCIIFTF